MESILTTGPPTIATKIHGVRNSIRDGGSEIIELGTGHRRPIGGD